MKILCKKISAAYRWYLGKPLAVLVAFVFLLSGSLYYAQDFYYDASADTLVAENDPDLLYFRKISEHFSDSEFMFLTYTPKNGDIFTKETVKNLTILVENLKAIKGVSSVTSLLDAPLLKSPPIPLSKLATGYKTLKMEDVDFVAAKKELTNSPLFSELLISKDGNTTAMRIDITQNAELKKMLDQRNKLRLIEKPTPEQKQKLKQAKDTYRKAYAESILEQEQLLEDIRAIRKSIQPEAVSYLGGVPMIASDMMHYVKSDIVIFGLSSVLLMMLSLFSFFRTLRWVLLPVLTTGVVLLITISILGFVHKPITVVSSNFISLLIILSISIAVHLITRYRSFIDEMRNLPHKEIIFKTMSAKIAPCVYTTFTTMAGFASLATSSIVPVMDFGWLMCMGVGMALIVFYLFFPIILMLLPKEKLWTPARDNNTPLIRISYHLAADHTTKVIFTTLMLSIVTVIGLSKLSIDNRFIDYFRKDTEIHQGLSFIDQHLGGTVPMDIIINFPPYTKEPAFDADEEDPFANDFTDDFADPFDDPFTENAKEETFPQKYWFTPDKIALLHKIEDYMKSRREIGKILSIATLETIAQDFNNRKPLGSVELIATLNALPQTVRDEFIAPYAVPEAGIMRITTRIHETGPTFSREQLINDIKDFAENTPGLKNRVHVTGLNVLFNGMLKELFTSQTSTLFFVIAATFMMFWILLRSATLGIIGLLPNVFSAFLIMAFMGFIGLPLDMMTITIAAIIIGIGVDDAIHYLHYFKERFNISRNVDVAVRESHREIGRALYITSLTVVFGFSVLAFSKFIPSISFGLLAAAAMILALAANLILLPALLLKFYRPKGKLLR